MSESWKNYTVIDEADSGKSWGTDYTVIDDEGLESAEAEDKPWYSAVTDAVASGLGGFNEAVFSALNAPWEMGREVHQMMFGGDVTTSLPGYDKDNHVSGANAIKNLLNSAISFGPKIGDVDESGVAYQVGKEGALNLASLTPAGMAAQSTKYTYGIFKPIIEYIRNNPKAAVLIDAGLSLPQGIGAWWGRQVGGDTGEELGRIAGAGSVAVPYGVYRGVKGVGNTLMRGFGQTESSQEHVTAEMLRGAMTKAEQDALMAGDFDLPPGGPFTTGETIDAGGLTRIRDAIIRQSDPSIGAEKTRLEARETKLLEELDALVSDTPYRTEAQVFIKNLLSNSLKRINALKDRAIIDAQARIDKLDPENAEGAASRIAREALNKAYKKALEQQTIVWGQIGDGRFLTRAIIQRAKEVVASTPRLTGPEGEPVIPQWIINIAGRDAVIGPNGKVIKKAKKSILNEVESAEEIAALSSALNQEISTHNTAGLFREAGMLGKVRDSIYDDIIPVVGDVAGLEQARAFSRVLNDKYTRGSVGRILDLKARGEVRVDPELTLEEIVKAGTRGKLGVLALRRAEQATSVGEKDFPHSELPPQPSAIDGPVKDFLTNKFLLSAMGENGINIASARRFVERYPVLDLYPELKAQMLDARLAQKLIKNKTDATLRRTQSIENQSVASKVIGGDAGVRIDSIITGKTQHPIRDTDELLRLASKDETGQALNGVKDALFDHIMTNITRQIPDTGRTILNPGTTTKFLNNKTNRTIITKVFGEEGMKLLDAVKKGMQYQMRGTPGGALTGGKEASATVGREFIGNMGTVMGVRLLGRITHQPLLSAGVGKRYALMAFDWLRNAPRQNVEALLLRALEEPDFARLLLTPLGRLKPEQAMSMYKYIVAKGTINIQSGGTNIDASEAADAVLTAADSVRSRVSAY